MYSEVRGEEATAGTLLCRPSGNVAAPRVQKHVYMWLYVLMLLEIMQFIFSLVHGGFFLLCLQVAWHLQKVIFCGVINHFQELLSISGNQFRVNLEINDLLFVCNMDKLHFRISVINKAV